MKILVLGGTGAMGAHLIKILAENGHDVFVTTRKVREDSRNITYLTGDAHANVFLEKLLEKHWDVIVDFMIYSTPEFHRRVGLLLRAAGQYVYLSSSRVYADSASPITEDSPRLLDVCRDPVYLATDEYALAKARQEDLLKNSGNRNWTVIRPYITYSETRLQLGVLEKESWLYRALHGRTIVFSKDIAPNTTTLTYGFDVARGIASILGVQGALGEVFHITHSEYHTWSEILSVYLDVLEKHFGKQPPVLIMDSFPDLKSGKYQLIYDRRFNRRFDNTKIGGFIDTSTFKPPLTGLKECLADFLEKPRFNLLPCRIEARADKLAGERTQLCELSDWKRRIKYLICRYCM